MDQAQIDLKEQARTLFLKAKADPSDVETLRSEINRILADDVERARLGRAGFDRAMSAFTWEETARKLEQAYNEALS